MSQIFAVDVSQSFCNLLHDCFTMLLIEFANEFWEVSIGAVLKDDYQVSFLFVGKELSGLQDVGMV